MKAADTYRSPMNTVESHGNPVSIRGLTRSFGDIDVIEGLDLEIEPGEFVALLGASGCGKSTLLRILAGLDRDISGEVRVAQERAVAFQSPRLMPWKRVWRNVILGLKKADKQTALVALEEVGMVHRADVWPKVLSGGEAQRASLARALVRQPDLLLLDEPFAALDALTRLKAQSLVENLWRKHGCSVLLVTHDVEEALLLADRILVMRDGKISQSLKMTVSRPRNIADSSIVEQRTQLLGWLGVHLNDRETVNG